MKIPSLTDGTHLWIEYCIPLFPEVSTNLGLYPSPSLQIEFSDQGISYIRLVQEVAEDAENGTSVGKCERISAIQLSEAGGGIFSSKLY